MDSPRGRIYQMVQVADGAPVTPSYVEHIGLCLACRGCETACPSGVQYGRLVEAAREQIESQVTRPGVTNWLGKLILRHLFTSPGLLTAAGAGLWLYQASGLQKLVRVSGVLRHFGKLAEIEQLSPAAEPPFFFSRIGRTFPAEGERRRRVAFLAGCIANVVFARLNEATVRVLQANGCDVVIPEGQTCCGAIHVHTGMREEARKLARWNIDAVIDGGFDAVITNAAGCGSTLKEYGELLDHDRRYTEKARLFASLVKDVNEFLASFDLNLKMGPVNATVCYQDSCHLAHGQKVRIPPRKLLAAVPGLRYKEMPLSDLCCGSAGIYNVVQNEMSLEILARKMEVINSTGADVVATANPGCMLQLQAGVRRFGKGQRVAHVIELLDEAYRNYRADGV